MNTSQMVTSYVKELAQPFPGAYVKDDGRGNSYVPHHIVTQRLIHIFGVPPKIELLREVYDAEKLTGVVMRLTVPGFEPVEEGGEADNPQSKTNGARLKDACSDAIKRCAMRLGLGLHLWAQENYYLFDALSEAPSEAKRERAASPSPEPRATGGEPVGSPPLPNSTSSIDLIDQAITGGITINGKRASRERFSLAINKKAMALTQEAYDFGNSDTAFFQTLEKSVAPEVLKAVVDELQLAKLLNITEQSAMEVSA